MTSERISTEPSAFRIALVVSVSTLALTVSYVDRQAMAALGPTIKRALDLDHTHWGALTSAFSIAYLIGAPLSGVLVDRVGARRTLLGAVMVWSVIAACHALVPGFAVLLALRIALGFAEAPSFPSAARAVTALTPERSRSAALGFLFTGSSIGAALAGPLAVYLEARFNFRVAFLVIAAAGLLYLPMFWAATRDPRIRLRIDSVARRDSSDQSAWRSILALLRERSVQRACILVVVSAPLVMLVINWLPQILETELDVPQRSQARYLWLPPVCFDVGAIGFAAWASLRDRARAGHKTDLVIAAAILQACAALALRWHSPWTGVAFLSIGMMGSGGLYALLTADMIARVGLARAGAAGGLTAAAQSLAHIIAAPIVGSVLDRTHSYVIVLSVLAMIGVPGAVVWALWPQKR